MRGCSAHEMPLPSSASVAPIGRLHLDTTSDRLNDPGPSHTVVAPPRLISYLPPQACIPFTHSQPDDDLHYSTPCTVHCMPHPSSSAIFERANGESRTQPRDRMEAKRRRAMSAFDCHQAHEDVTRCFMLSITTPKGAKNPDRMITGRAVF